MTMVQYCRDSGAGVVAPTITSPEDGSTVPDRVPLTLEGTATPGAQVEVRYSNTDLPNALVTATEADSEGRWSVVQNTPWIEKSPYEYWAIDDSTGLESSHITVTVVEV